MIKGFLKKFWDNLKLIAPLSLLLFILVSLISVVGVLLFKHLHIALAFLLFFIILTLVITLVYTLFVYDPNMENSNKRKDEEMNLADILPFIPRD